MLIHSGTSGKDGPRTPEAGAGGQTPQVGAGRDQRDVRKPAKDGGGGTSSACHGEVQPPAGSFLKTKNKTIGTTLRFSAAPRDNMAPSPDQKFMHASATPTRAR